MDWIRLIHINTICSLEYLKLSLKQSMPVVGVLWLSLFRCDICKYMIFIKSAFTPSQRTFPPYKNRLILPLGSVAGSDDRSHQWSGLGRLQRSAPTVPLLFSNGAGACRLGGCRVFRGHLDVLTSFFSYDIKPRIEMNWIDWFDLVLKTTNPQNNSWFAYSRCFLCPANKQRHVHCTFFYIPSVILWWAGRQKIWLRLPKFQHVYYSNMVGLYWLQVRI